MKIVIIGANGVIGNALFAALSPLFQNCIGLTTKTVPSLVTVNYDFLSIKEFIAKSDVIIYCIGVSKFIECEQFPEKSMFLNVELPQEILKNISAGQTFIYFSSPVAMYDFKHVKAYNYARHKKMAEDIIMQSRHNNFLIVRPSKIIESIAILREWKNSLSKQEKIFPFFDQYISPLNTAILSGHLIQLICGRHLGCYNFSAADRLSYLQIAEALCRYFTLDENLIEKQSAKSNNRFFLEQDILDCSQAEKAIGYVPPRSDDVVIDYFQKLVDSPPLIVD